MSTAVGGVPEVLPRPMIKFAEPTVEDLTDALSDAIPLARKAVPSDFHAKVQKVVGWNTDKWNADSLFRCSRFGVCLVLRVPVPGSFAY